MCNLIQNLAKTHCGILHIYNIYYEYLCVLGLPSNYPMLLTYLNLSHNKLQKMDIIETEANLWTVKYCYNPSRREQRHVRSVLVSGSLQRSVKLETHEIFFVLAGYGITLSQIALEFSKPPSS